MAKNFVEPMKVDLWVVVRNHDFGEDGSRFAGLYGPWDKHGDAVQYMECLVELDHYGQHYHVRKLGDSHHELEA